MTTPSLDILTVEDCESLQLNFVYVYKLRRYVQNVRPLKKIITYQCLQHIISALVQCMLFFRRMLLALSEDLYLVGNPLHDIVWGAMCCHLEFYDLQMKIVSTSSFKYSNGKPVVFIGLYIQRKIKQIPVRLLVCHGLLQ